MSLNTNIIKTITHNYSLKDITPKLTSTKNTLIISTLVKQKLICSDNFDYTNKQCLKIPENTKINAITELRNQQILIHANNILYIVSLYDTTSILYTITVHPQFIQNVLEMDNNLLITTSSDNVVRVFDQSNKYELIKTIVIASVSLYARKLEKIKPNLFAICSYEHRVLIWDTTKDFKCVASISVRSPIAIKAFQGNYLILIADGKIEVYDDKYEIINEFDFDNSYIIVSSSFEYIITASHYGSIKLWDEKFQLIKAEDIDDKIHALEEIIGERFVCAFRNFSISKIWHPKTGVFQDVETGLCVCFNINRSIMLTYRERLCLVYLDDFREVYLNMEYNSSERFLLLKDKRIVNFNWYDNIINFYY
jgi:WD40 repeat protein